MAAIAIAIVLESGRPYLFWHERVGKGGRPFFMCKFRKFRRECSPDGLQLTLDGDERFTRIGEFLARTKLDELPQFWNVLIGDMAIVGPRPESLNYADCFTGEFEVLLEYKPGILGPSQVYFRAENQIYPKSGDLDKFYRENLFPAKARSDLSYYPKRTLTSDISWILKGVAAVIGVPSKKPN